MTAVRGGWSEAEDQVIRSRYAQGGTPACLPSLPGRSRAAIKNRAGRLGIAFDPLPQRPTLVVGKIWGYEVGRTAAVAARRIIEVGRAMAVTLDGASVVRLARPEDASDAGLAGVYEPELGVVAITSYMRDDLIALRRGMRAAA